MLKLLIIAAILGLCACTTDDDWEKFKSKYGKTYPSDEEEGRRKANWKANHDSISEHNSHYDVGEKSYFLGENEFSDWTPAEMAKMNGLKVRGIWDDFKHFFGFDSSSSSNDDDNDNNDNNHNPNGPDGLPTSVNWVDRGYVTSVKNQGQCGSCYTFSSAGALEGQHFKKTGQLVDLSESNILDCSQSFGNHGCNGGYMTYAFKYVMSNGGIDLLSSYPYAPKVQPCRYSNAHIGTTATSFRTVQRNSEAALKQAVATVGPVSVGIDANQTEFNNYKGGVYDNPSCTQTIDHAVLVVGYGTENGKDYWLVKNSWGTSWGIDGYVKMSRNKGNQCGIAVAACYPIV